MDKKKIRTLLYEVFSPNEDTKKFFILFLKIHPDSRKCFIKFKRVRKVTKKYENMSLKRKYTFENHILLGEKGIRLLKDVLPSLYRELKRVKKSEDPNVFSKYLSMCFEMSSLLKEIQKYKEKHNCIPESLDLKPFQMYRKLYLSDCK